jgi:putative transposase
MEVPLRKKLPHEVPFWVDPQTSIYFITINCERRGINQLARANIATSLLDSVQFRNEKHVWFAHLFLVMPDHVHALMSFPPSASTLQERITSWKRWTARQLGINSQNDFFEHRLRSDESRCEKANYILANPVRKNLVREACEWPFVLIAQPR